MINFSADFLENFLAVVRKYMQLRGGLTQKDLSEMTGVGISTMSRFLNLKTANVDEQLVANIMATLNIPLHEVIDGIAEDSTDTFKRLVLFYKEQMNNKAEATLPEEELASGLDDERTKTKTTASINIGGKKQNISFGEQTTPKPSRPAELSIREKLQTLSPRQKAYITDFLDLGIADRDLIVDLGDAIFRYVRQRNVDF
ncbi:MAG: helix-turn-helix transcriptional regulator [Bacteriovoracaceae bacterium]|nr:helix-turn-helix transcriptional regulator [Bacteriovoracaceae bacterium]